MPFDTTILSALTKILELDEPESLKGELACALRCLPGTCHASVWGLDDRSKRVFFAFEFLDQPSIKDFSSLCVRQYGEGLIGDVAIHKRDVIYTAASIPGNLMPDTQAAIRNHNIATIAIFAPNAPKDYPCLVVITSTEEIEGDMNRHLGLLKCLFGGFLASYSRAKAKLFENQIHNIIRSKGVSHGIDFLKDACAPIASAFGARSFSIWRIISGTVSPEHFSEPHSVSEYKVGEGITGYVAKTGEPVLLHRVDDAYEMYNVKWVGKASDFNGRKANPGDHLMVVPLNYPKSLQGKAQTNGLIRFVAPFDGPSFWPIDFARACEIGVAISSLLRLDEVLQLETRNNKIHKNLLSLVYTAESSHSIDEVSLSFLTEIEGWPGVVRTDLFQENESGQLEFDEASRLNKNVIEILSGIKWKGQQTPVCIERIWWACPIHGEKEFVAVLVVEVCEDACDACVDWLRLATLILGHFFSASRLLEETAQLRRTNEEQEMWAFAGAMARDLAHEALNGLKAIQSWISNSRATASPNYSQLEERAQQILRNVNDLLDSTGFEQSHKRRCIFNRELEKYLKQLGFRNNKYIGKCVIKLDVADFKQRWVNFDPATLIFVLHNLVLNAKEQYEQVNRAGPIEIRIVEKEFGGIPYIGFSVLDYAVGIAAENIFNVFDRGFTTKPNGRGIGLSTVKRLVDEAEGRIEVDSEPGRYAKFYVFYPVIQSDDDVS